MIEVDLSQFKCPQFFVQFRWQLKQAQQKNSAVCFTYNKNQDISDILAYLNNKQLQHKHIRAEKPHIEVYV